MIDLALLTDEVTDPFQFLRQSFVASYHVVQCVIDLAGDPSCINRHANREIAIPETCEDSQHLSVVHYICVESFNLSKSRAH
jgi:hypothetical protein